MCGNSISVQMNLQQPPFIISEPSIHLTHNNDLCNIHDNDNNYLSVLN